MIETVEATVAQGSSLPTPPDDREQRLYAKRGVGPLTLCSIFALTGVLASTVGLMGVHPLLGLCGLVFTLFLGWFFLSTEILALSPRRQTFSWKAHRAVVDGWAPGHVPSVDVWLPVCGEPLAVLANTWSFVAGLDWPGTLSVHVFDDGGSEDVRTLAESFGFSYSSRPNRGWLRKAGNLQFAYGHTDGEFVLVLDADFCPRADMLRETIPYFSDDQSLGIVQTPQYFRVSADQTWVARGAAAVQEYFYRAVQPSRNGFAAAICVGTCAVYRRAALDANGGMTLIGHSEDVHTGFDLRRRGWSLRYLPVAVATGLCPSDLAAFYRQQYRWCAGSMSLVLSRKFWTTKLSLQARACYLSGFYYYVYTAVAAIALPVLPLALLTFFPSRLSLDAFIIVLPAMAYVVAVFPAWHRCRYGLETWSTRLVYGWAHLFALVDTLRGRQSPWEPTGAVGLPSASFDRFRRAFLAWTGTTTVLWVVMATLRSIQEGLVHVGPFLALGLFMTVNAGRVIREFWIRTQQIHTPTSAELLIDAMKETVAVRCSATVIRGHRCGRIGVNDRTLCASHVAMGWSSRDEYTPRPRRPSRRTR